MFYTTPAGGWMDPFRELERMHQEMGRLFGGLRIGRTADFPAVNLWAGEKGVVVTALVPGIEPDTIEITAHRNTLTLKGKREQEAAGDDVTYHRRERSYGSFSRTIALPFNVDPEKVDARFENGVLSIELPRPEEDKPKRIKVQKN
ncbi:MAG: Hsp20/alpha crystallin family protein [Roseibium sp.]